MLWRWTPRRLEAESIRDSILFVQRAIDLLEGGSSVGGVECCSIYLTQKRDSLPSEQVLFDGANGITSCSRRRVSTNALQPLWLMNSELVQGAAAEFAGRAGDVETVLCMALHRDGDDEEVATLRSLAVRFGLESACLAIFNSSEFLYLP